MKDLGELRYFLGLEVIRCDDGIWLFQRQYGLDMLSKYGVTTCKPLSVPLEQNVKLSADIGDEIEDPTMFRRIILLRMLILIITLDTPSALYFNRSKAIDFLLKFNDIYNNYSISKDNYPV